MNWQSFWVAFVVAFVVGGGPFHLFALVRDVIRDRRSDVRLGLRKHWWSHRKYPLTTFADMSEMYRMSNEATRAAFRGTPERDWLRQYPKEAE